MSYILYKHNRMKKKNLYTLLKGVFALLMIFLFGACSKPMKDITYMYGIKPGTIKTEKPVPETYKVKINDHLYINVIGDDPLAVQFLNLSPATNSNSSSGGNMELITYIVDESGNISYPQFGSIHVAGKTVEEIRVDIQKRVDQYIQNASVFVKLVNRNITVLGEVNSPGQHEMVKNQLSIFEALGTAGDITDFGNRKNVKLIRETEAGRQVAQIDLTDQNLVNSPHYYILPNDVIYVEPSDKVYGKKTFPLGTAISVFFSAISTAILIYSLF